MNLNKLAKTIAKKEGKKRETNIAQIKEILRITLQELAKATEKDVQHTLNRYRKKKR